MPSRKTVVRPAPQPASLPRPKKIAIEFSIDKETPGAKHIILKEEDIRKVAKAMLKELMAAIASSSKK